MFLFQSKTCWIADTPAKVNLFFEILGKRNDGYHEIVSLAVPIHLFDTVLFESTDDSQIRFDCLGGEKNVPLDENNLVVRAAKLLQKRFNIQNGAAIKLIKRIPSQAGLGGGSSDASATLCLANRVWNLHLSDEELLPIAAEIGSDCPLFFYNTPTISTGRGEKIKPLSAIPPLWLVVIKPPEGLSTTEVYAKYQPNGKNNFRNINDFIVPLASGNVREIGKHLFNRLEESAKIIWHRFDEVKRSLVESGCLTAQMSGSGTAFFGLCQDEDHAKKVMFRLQSNFLSTNNLFLASTYGTVR